MGKQIHIVCKTKYSRVETKVDEMAMRQIYVVCRNGDGESISECAQESVIKKTGAFALSLLFADVVARDEGGGIEAGARNSTWSLHCAPPKHHPAIYPATEVQCIMDEEELD